MSAIYSALSGIHQAENQLNVTATRIASLPSVGAKPTSNSTAVPTDSVSLSDEFVSLIQAKNSAAANVKSAQTADQLQQSLLSLFR